MSNIKQQAFEAIDRSAELVCQVSDAVWEHPETAFEEFESMKIHCDALEQAGFTVERGVGNIATAFTASYGKGGPKIGLLAEYDALSGLSQEAGVAEKKPSSIRGPRRSTLRMSHLSSIAKTIA